ncbi:DUF4153 domain-containing protein [Parashewanella tropica]|uniref:DUF4153 domain-containing protein n=1 Tax=Parashewanella tropica TaxID=2547970 RepID=UPI00105A83A3|nr:DUF4153 domain-containing protein [Parashewanella tropica]
MDSQLPKSQIIAISAIQGIALTLLYLSHDHQMWPATSPMWLTALVTLALSLPLLLLLCITKTNDKAVLTYLAPFTVLLSVLGGYVGFQQEPVEFVRNYNVIPIFTFTALIASFKALMYIQQRVSQQPISYGALFELSWRNFILFGESCLFVLFFWGILHLGASLFAVIEIDFFKTLLNKEWFTIPVLSLAFGFATIVFRNITNTLATIAAIFHTLFKFLLPALTIVSLGFLVTLPFTGLGTLWKTGSGSFLVLWLQALSLFFVNAVYQGNNDERPYHVIIHRLIFIGVALLPIYSVIAAYGLWLRIDQYGLTVDRCWAVMVWLLLACFAVGYLWGIIRKRDAWVETQSQVNIGMGLAVLVLLLLVNSPLLNFQSLSASSQLARLEKGFVTPEQFDFAYFERSLGRQGYLAIQQLEQEWQTSAPEKVAILDRLYTQRSHFARETAASSSGKEAKKTLVNFKKQMVFWPNKGAFPESLLEKVYFVETEHNWQSSKSNTYYFIARDLNDDGKPDFVVIKENSGWTSAKLWQLQQGEWKASYMKTTNPSNLHYLKSLLDSNDVTTVKPKWDKLKVGDLTFEVQ